MTKSYLKPLYVLPMVAFLGACQVPVVLTDANSMTQSPNPLTDLEMSQTESLKAVSEV